MTLGGDVIPGPVDLLGLSILFLFEGTRPIFEEIHWVFMDVLSLRMIPKLVPVGHAR